MSGAMTFRQFAELRLASLAAEYRAIKRTVREFDAAQAKAAKGWQDRAPPDAHYAPACQVLEPKPDFPNTVPHEEPSGWPARTTNTATSAAGTTDLMVGNESSAPEISQSNGPSLSIPILEGEKP